MSYDLLVFRAGAIPEGEKDREAFMAWYREQTTWSEDHSYNDPAVSAPNLRAWMTDMTQRFPAMNGPLADAGADPDNLKITDYCVGKDMIYMAFSWSVVEEAYGAVKSLAFKHGLDFFDVSADNGDILYPL